MRISFLPLARLTLCATVLSGCSDIAGTIDFIENRDAFNERTERLLNRSNTAFAGIPETGTRTFNGEASLGVGDRDNGVVLIGDAQMTIDFESGDVDGQLGNFGGFDETKEYSDYAGILVLNGGQLGVDRPNDVQTQITGTLTGEQDVIFVDAWWVGDLKGTPIRGVLGQTDTSESVFELNGAPVLGGIAIAVE